LIYPAPSSSAKIRLSDRSLPAGSAPWPSKRRNGSERDGRPAFGAAARGRGARKLSIRSLPVDRRHAFFAKTSIEIIIVRVLPCVSRSDKASCYIADLTAHRPNHRITAAPRKRHSAGGGATPAWERAVGPRSPEPGRTRPSAFALARIAARRDRVGGSLWRVRFIFLNNGIPASVSSCPLQRTRPTSPRPQPPRARVKQQKFGETSLPHLEPAQLLENPQNRQDIPWKSLALEPQIFGKAWH
jgi:hypothetical protein